MKQILFIIYTFFFKLFKPKVQVVGSCVAKLKVSVADGNDVVFESAHVGKSSLDVEGVGNSFTCSSMLHKVNIHIAGNNNTVTLLGAKLNSADIVVRGNGCSVVIGKGSSMGSGSIICMGKDTEIVIGENTMMADDIEIWNTDSHGIFDLEHNLLNPSKSVRIGNHVWLGKYAKVLKGVTIGDDAVIGMGATVTKDVRPNTLNVGSPAREVREGITWDRNYITKYELE